MADHSSSMSRKALKGAGTLVAGGFLTHLVSTGSERAFIVGNPPVSRVHALSTEQNGIATSKHSADLEQQATLSNATASLTTITAAMGIFVAGARRQVRARRNRRERERVSCEAIVSKVTVTTTTDVDVQPSGRTIITTVVDVNPQGMQQAPTAPLAVDAQAGPVMPPGMYCEAVEKMKRRKTRTVMVGGVPIGSEHPIAVQTMATTSTHIVEDTVAQVKKCADAGVDIVRITVPGMREAKAMEFIKKRLLEDGYKTPLVADIHFTPKVALHVADFVDKVRINPGNFADGKKSFDTIEKLTEEDIEQYIAEIDENLSPLILKLKDLGKAMRVGVNHGSLSERILFQYGDSPEGMVASAVEVAEICRKHNYHDMIFSMKSSNPKVMVEAYRLLAKEMYQRGWDYPLHLGVTEAGGGSDGRIKSAVGIGTLLLDGLGDTIRVSLTEDPEYEIHPCQALRDAAQNAVGKGVEPFDDQSRREKHVGRRECEFPIDVPLNSDGSVFASINAAELSTLSQQELVDRMGLRTRADGDVQKEWKSVDVLVIDGEVDSGCSEKLQTLLNVPMGVVSRGGPGLPAGATLLRNGSEVIDKLEGRVGGHALLFDGTESLEVIERACQNASPRFVLLRPATTDGVTFLVRRFFNRLTSVSPKLPIMLWFRYPKLQGQDEDDVVIKASAHFGSCFVDNIGEGMLWDTPVLSPNALRESSFNLLQASRMRITKTEFISCPSCGRTLFNLQETTARIQSRTGHLPGVRIAVMGCIVNGPGEMADADFGYVGSGVGKIDLYVKYDVVRRGIASDTAVDELIELIKEHGKWQEPVDPVEEVTSIRHSAVAVL